MIIDTQELISVSEANQNFSRATRIADRTGKAVILKGNRPKYLLIDIEADPRLLLSDDERNFCDPHFQTPSGGI